jgi:hypothetical protein
MWKLILYSRLITRFLKFALIAKKNSELGKRVYVRNFFAISREANTFIR